MKEKIETIAAIIFLILLTVFLTMAPSARCSDTMDPIRQQIKEESMIF